MYYSNKILILFNSNQGNYAEIMETNKINPKGVKF